MRISRATAAPRIVFAGDRPILISPPSLRDFGLIFNYLEDSVAPPEGAPADWTPSLEDEGSRARLGTEFGLAVLLFAAMRRDNPEVRLADAADLVASLDAHDRLRVQEVALVCSRPAPPRDVSHWRPGGRPDRAGIPLDRVGFGRMMERPEFAGFAPDAIANWSLDQLENKLQGGEPDVDERIREGEPLSAEDVAGWMRRMQDPAERARVAAERGEGPPERPPEDPPAGSPAPAGPPANPSPDGRPFGVVPEGIPELIRGFNGP